MKQVGFKPGMKEGVMDAHSGESEWEEVMDAEIGESGIEKRVPE